MPLSLTNLFTKSKGLAICLLQMTMIYLIPHLMIILCVIFKLRHGIQPVSVAARIKK